VRYELCIRLTEVPLLTFRLTRGIERFSKKTDRKIRKTGGDEKYTSLDLAVIIPLFAEIIREYNARLIHEIYAEPSDIISSYPSKLIAEVSVSAIIHSRFVSLNYSSRIAYFQYESSCEEREGRKNDNEIRSVTLPRQ
jgi:hypothetical protein